MAISRSSALKINTGAWITFSITISPKPRFDCASLQLLPVCLYVNALCVLPRMFGLLEESLELRLSSRRMETQVGLRSRVVCV